MAPKKPAHEIRMGNVRAAIWANGKKPDEVWFNVTVSRSYKDEEGWKDTTSFRRDDLPVAAKALDMAYQWIWERQRAADPQGEVL